jgi:hypothetical protein
MKNVGVSAKMKAKSIKAARRRNKPSCEKKSGISASSAEKWRRPGGGNNEISIEVIFSGIMYRLGGGAAAAAWHRRGGGVIGGVAQPENGVQLWLASMASINNQ